MKATVTLSIALFVWAATAAQAQTLTVALKGGAGAAALASSRSLTVALDKKPPKKLAREPRYRSAPPLYGAIKLGNAPDNVYTIALDETTGNPGDTHLYVDKNNDGDLTDDGEVKWQVKGAVLLASITFSVKYVEDGRVTAQPYALMVYRNRGKPNFLYCFRDSLREGEVTIGSKRYLIVLLDDNADGLFNDLEDTVLLIDTDGDGKLNGAVESHEWYRADKPFNAGGATYEVVAVEPDGMKLTLRHASKSVPPKAILLPGHPAPQFTAQDVKGKTVSLEQLKGKVVLLDFWALDKPGGTEQFPNVKRCHQTFADKGLVIISVSLDDNVTALKKFIQARFVDWTQICDGKGYEGALPTLYRIRGLPSNFLIDGGGTLVGVGLRGEALYNAVLEAVSKK